MTSAAKPTNLLVDFIPFAIGAVVVLCKPVPPQIFTSPKRAVASCVRPGIYRDGERGRFLDVAVLQRNSKACPAPDPDPSPFGSIHSVH